MSVSPKSSPPVGNPLRLRWDGVRLWMGDRVIRPYQRFAPRQAALLDEFQARGWSAEPVPDPFPREGWEEPEDIRSRLRSAVENLNRDVARGTIRFHITGNYVWWEPARRRRRQASPKSTARCSAEVGPGT
jgi:hypothetical protein